MLRRGWIPTVTGNLSFSAIGNSSSPKRLVSTFREISETQYVIVIMRRRTSDALFGIVGDLLNWIAGRDGWFTFYAIGKAEKGSSENGFHNKIKFVCCAIPDKYKARSQVITENVQSQLSVDYDFIRTHEWVDQQARTLSIEAGIPPVAAIVERSGACTVAVPNERQDQELETLLKQTYFFLRDAAHTHQHHEKKSDSILSVYPDTDDVGRTWNVRVLFALHRWIIQQKRRKDQIGAIRSSGILAYAEVFRENHIDHQENVSFSRFSSTNLAASLRSTEIELALYDNSSRRHVAMLSSFLALLFIPIATFTFVANDERPVEPSAQLQTVDALTQLIFENPITWIFTALTILISVCVATIYPKLLTKMTFVSDITRLSLSFGKSSKFMRYFLGTVLLIGSSSLLTTVF